MTQAELITDLKRAMVAELHLEGVSENDITDDLPLFGEEGLGMDSLDAVELVVLVEKHYGVAIQDADVAHEVFRSTATLAGYILEHGASA